MITQDDINAMSPALEYARRARKGLPADRLSDGTEGDYAVAKGIEAQARIIRAQTAVLEVLWEEVQAAQERAAEGLTP